MAEKIKTLDIPVDGMHCSSCSLVVEKSLNKLDAVESTDVDLNTNKAHISRIYSSKRGSGHSNSRNALCLMCEQC